MKYLEFLRYALDEEQGVPESLDQMDWEGLYRFAEQQSILGVMFEGVQRLGEQGVRPPFQLLMDWVAAAGQIEEQNRTVNRVAVKFLAQLRQDGFEGCILKGQGNNLLYPNVYSRMSGDVDVWVRKVESLELRVESGESLEYRAKSLEFRVESLEGEVIRYVKERNPKARAVYHHIDYGEFDEVEVEMHYRPSFMFNPVHNRRLQRWFVNHADEQFRHEVELPDGVGKVCVPTREFNIFFQLSHIYNHVLHEGIGLRQVVDYFFLLRGERCEVRGVMEDGRGERGVKFRVERVEGKDGLGLRVESLEKMLRSLGLWKIAMAMMWVLHEVLGLEEEYLIAPMDERLGRVLLSEIMRGGNFGQYDEQNIKADNALKKNWQRICRDFRMMRYFPSECLWEPVFRIWHFFWRFLKV